jgi:hypothetical protein
VKLLFIVLFIFFVFNSIHQGKFIQHIYNVFSVQSSDQWEQMGVVTITKIEREELGSSLYFSFTTKDKSIHKKCGCFFQYYKEGIEYPLEFYVSDNMTYYRIKGTMYEEYFSVIGVLILELSLLILMVFLFLSINTVFGRCCIEIIANRLAMFFLRLSKCFKKS